MQGEEPRATSRAVDSATRVGLRTHLAPDEDDLLSSYDNFVVMAVS